MGRVLAAQGDLTSLDVSLATGGIHERAVRETAAWRVFGAYRKH